MKLKGVITCAFMFPGILFCSQAFAVEDLYLCGVVREINTKDALVTVDVTSHSCRGLRKFKFTPGKVSFTLDERKCFFIDRDRCSTGSVPAITRQ